ncbi:hypothetical protein [Roseibium sediminicola]|uniref:Secreted protein n=1 Tax=Roseibium sediminicola TaxID=2933272 RepID=A0ABT0H2G6_9HYPH|nr:hypothetical protein [Roseibium sp. CAU 1639]MCK7615856.1 hypothetical protein [Roseibium sp. CAU 1639]
MPYVLNFGTSLRLGKLILAAALLMAAAVPATTAETVEPSVVSPGEETARTEQQDPSTSVTTRCNGILKPAPVGDRDLVEPAPEKGRMPVLDPEDIPAQPAPDQN